LNAWALIKFNQKKIKSLDSWAILLDPLLSIAGRMPERNSVESILIGYRLLMITSEMNYLLECVDQTA